MSKAQQDQAIVWRMPDKLVISEVPIVGFDDAFLDLMIERYGQCQWYGLFGRPELDGAAGRSTSMRLARLDVVRATGRSSVSVRGLGRSAGGEAGAAPELVTGLGALLSRAQHHGASARRASLS